MPRGKFDANVSPERVEQLKLEVAELERRRAEASALLQLPLTIESMKERIEALNTEYALAREKAQDEFDTFVSSLKILSEDEKKTILSQKDKLLDGLARLTYRKEQLEGFISSLHLEMVHLEKKISEHYTRLEFLKNNTEIAEDILHKKQLAMDRLMDEFRNEALRIEKENKTLDQTKAELKAKDHNLASLQAVLNMQLADARERLNEVELREKSVAEAHTKNCDRYNELIVIAGNHERDYNQKIITLNRRALALNELEEKILAKEKDLEAREKDLVVNWEVFKKEKAKHEWASRGQ